MPDAVHGMLLGSAEAVTLKQQSKAAILHAVSLINVAIPLPSAQAPGAAIAFGPGPDTQQMRLLAVVIPVTGIVPKLERVGVNDTVAKPVQQNDTVINNVKDLT